MHTILIIDDDSTQRSLLSHKLSEQFRVLTAVDGITGWNIILKEQPDLILLDIMLPGGMNGFELLDQLKRTSNLKDVPVLVLTNLDSEEKAARKIGVADYLIKANTSIEDITKKITSLLPHA